ncbi:uncharacterized protein LOC143502764 isoform X1 [Brachyhypopomus gauderio]|uniref:uncharacterized protein LOC143502764 isoform X1 n=1 Tax=Brachyhypopomus gauderio TaxID=698409 RepID=UPI004042DBDE
MDEDGYPITDYRAAIEWRKGKKPKHGWPIYCASIKFVSNNRFHINNKIREFLCSLSVEREEPLPKKRVPVPPKKLTEDDSEDTDIECAPVIPNTQKGTAQTFLKKYHSVASVGVPRKLEELASENEELKKENEKLKSMLFKELPEIIKEMKTVLKTKTSSSNSDLESVSEESSNVCQPSVLRAEQVEIYPGSNIFIDRLTWAVAQNANSASSFVRTLLTAVFPMDVLLVSNLRGKSRDSGDQRQALEKSKVDAIYRATLAKWPHVIPSTIGTTINAKLTEIRAKRKLQKPQEKHMLCDQ